MVDFWTTRAGLDSSVAAMQRGRALPDNASLRRRRSPPIQAYATATVCARRPEGCRVPPLRPRTCARYQWAARWAGARSVPPDRHNRLANLQVGGASWENDV